MRNEVLSKHNVSLAAIMAASGLLLMLGAVSPMKGVQPQETYILKGNPMGPVKFDHKAHMTRAGGKCQTCHHASKPEKPLKAPQEACMDCHTRPPQPGMTTGLPGAFHNPTATAGTCIDCHKTENAAGKKAPTKCMECHKKENA